MEAHQSAGQAEFRPVSGRESLDFGVNNVTDRIFEVNAYSELAAPVDMFSRFARHPLLDILVKSDGRVYPVAHVRLGLQSEGS